MTYTPIKYIIQTGSTLTEYADLTKPLSYFLNLNAFLIVRNSYRIQYVISLSKILTFVDDLNLTLPISTALNTLLTDAFVIRYNDPGIPIANDSGYYENRLRVFNPISYKDYEVDFTSVDQPDIINSPILRGSLDDLVIKSSEILNNSLVAVNGVFHKTAMQENDLYVLDGFRTIRLCGRRDVTLVDTTNIGGHTVLPLTSSNVSQSTYNGRAVITLGQSILNKTVCIIIDGYFYHLDTNVLKVIDNTHISIETGLLPLIQQFRHNPRTVYQPDRLGDGPTQQSGKYEDAYTELFLDTNHVPISNFTNRDFQFSRLTAFHSFLVIFNRPNIFKIEREVLPTGSPRFYYDYTDLPLAGMLSYGCGLCPSYLIHEETPFRKQIFISDQDDFIDYQDQSLYPAFIPTQTRDALKMSTAPATFIDYVSP